MRYLKLRTEAVREESQATSKRIRWRVKSKTTHFFTVLYSPKARTDLESHLHQKHSRIFEVSILFF